MSSNRPISRAGIGSFSRSNTTSQRLSRRSSASAHHVVPSGEVVEERSIRDVGALADVFDRRGRHASIQEQLERRTQNQAAHLLLAHAWRRTHFRRGAAEPTRCWASGYLDAARRSIEQNCGCCRVTSSGGSQRRRRRKATGQRCWNSCLAEGLRRSAVVCGRTQVGGGDGRRDDAGPG